MEMIKHQAPVVQGDVPILRRQPPPTVGHDRADGVLSHAPVDDVAE
jgi:hypothetical protein